MKTFIFTILTLGFFQLQAQSELQKAEWFVDTDPGFHRANRVDFTPNSDEVVWEFDLSELDLGVHYLGTRVLDEHGVWSPTLTRAFLVLPPAQTGIVYAEYFIDSDPGFRNAIPIPISDDASAWEIDLNDLVGVHYLHIRAQQASGGWSHTLTRSFLVLPPAQPGMTYAEWYIDDDPGFHNAKAVPVSADTASWEIDLSGLEVGVHYLHVRTQQASGGWTPTLTRAFLVAEEGESPIERIAYRYTDEQGEELRFSYVLDMPRHYIDLDFEPDTTGLIGGENYELCFSVVTVGGAASPERCLEFEAEGMPSSTEKSLKEVGIKLYPNPVREFLRVELMENQSAKKVSIITAEGRFLMQQRLDGARSLDIPVAHLPKGHYNLVIETDETLIVRRFVVQ